MKIWESPEMKVFSVKMNENIAASGDTTSGDTEFIIISRSDTALTVQEGSAYFIVNGTLIQGTGISYQVTSSGTKWIPGAEYPNVTGCIK